MCGIAGFVGSQQSEADAEVRLRAMCGAIRHRGPDDEGRLVLPAVALGMRRLSVIDVAGGAQPLGNEDDSVQVVFNGEIYNHAELHAALEKRGHRFRTRSDTETLVHLYEDHGDDLVQHLRGMFAFALWDAPRRRLLIARDRVGIKPLYYRFDGGVLSFASELRSFLADDRFDARIDRAAVASYLAFGYIPDPQSIFVGVRKLPPGHLLVLEPGGAPEVRRYWSPMQRAPQPAIDATEATREVRRLIVDAVSSHLVSDVPIGAFLSGGVDSSAVVAAMARQLDRPVKTFSIGFDEDAFNEAPHAAAVARALGTDHTELVVRPDADALVEEVVETYDEPFADSSALPTYLVSRLAREHVTVSLSGDGGDELFGGYTRYAELLGRRELGPAPVRAALRAAARRLPHGARGRNRLLDLARVRQGRYAATVTLPLSAEEGGVARADVAALAPALEHGLAPWFEEVADRDFLSQMTLVDIATYLPGDILTKVDRASMAHSLEARVPLLDHPLVEFAASLPSRLKIVGGVGKWVMREAVRDLLPPVVLQRPKQGFAVPLATWFRGPLRHRLEALTAPGARIREYVDDDALQRIVREHRAARRDHSAQLWRLLALEIWLEGLARGNLSRPAGALRSAAPISADPVAAA